MLMPARSKSFQRNTTHLICDSNRFSSRKVHVSAEEASELNIKMAKQANVHIFANDKQSLRTVMQYVGSHFDRLKL